MISGLQEVKFRIYNSTLDPKIWDENMVLNPEVKVKLLKVAQDFYRNTELKSPIVDILFLGSTTNYNWTPTSDIDLHIVIDITKENVAPEHARQFMDGLGAGWNNNHEIVIRGHPVEVYLQDQTEKNSTPAQSREGSTIYSLLKGCWLKVPDRNRVDIDKEKIKQKYHKIKKMVDEFVADKNVDKLKKLMKALKNYRNAGLERVGEFSTENLVFKALRHTNVITKLKDAINTLYDKSASLNEKLGDGNYLVIGLTNSDLQVIGQKKTDQHSDLDHGLLRGSDRMMDTHHPVHWRYRSKDNTIYWWHGDVTGLDSDTLEKIRDATKDFLRMKFGVKSALESQNPDAYFSKGHHINEMISTDKLVIGNITDDLEINGVKVSDPDKSGNHHGTGARWRYRTRPDLRDIVFWWEAPTPYQQEQLSDFLQRKWHAPRKLRHRNLDDLSWNGADVLHGYQNKFSKSDLRYLKENIGIDNLYVGIVTPDLNVQVRKATPKKTGHMTLFPDAHSQEYRGWRYRKDLNELFWWDEPTADEKEEVLAWLQSYLGVTQKPKQTIMYSVDRILQGKGKSVFGTPIWYASHPDRVPDNKIDEGLNPKANLFLGFIRRDDFKVVGTHVPDDDFTHFHFQYNLGPGWRELGDSQFIPWRYKKSTNTVYWWYPKPHPNEDEKKEVEWWLEKNLNVRQPQHKMISNYAPENPERVADKWDSHTLTEGKFNPFTAKTLDFVTYGGLSLTKQKGFGKEDPTFHAPPARKGIYAFVWPYIERFLLGGAEFIDPKQRGKGQRQRMKYVKDKEGNVISSDHPDWEKANQGERGKNWSFSRERPDSKDVPDDDKQYTHFLYNNAARKKFKYSGPLWHHLEEFVREDRILDRKGSWVKTDMESFKEALKKELHRVMKADMEFGKGKQFRGLGQSSHIWDNLEVFIDQKI